MKTLSTAEINMVLEKIRGKYQNLINQYKKNPGLLDAFQERYVMALKLRKNLSVFLLAEIQAVEELLTLEDEKQKNALRKKNAKQQVSFVDKVMQENQRRYQLYPELLLSDDSDEEINYLCGAAREYLNLYFPVAVIIEKRIGSSALQRKFIQHYDDLSAHIGYEGSVSVSRHYLDALIAGKDDSRLMFEYQRLIQDIGFLLNTSLDLLQRLCSEIDETSDGNRKLENVFREASLSGDVVKVFKGKTFCEAAHIILEYLEKLIGNFRLRDIRKV